ncbi:MAG: hypothetical protein ACLSHL_09305 [Alistipes communis]
MFDLLDSGSTNDELPSVEASNIHPDSPFVARDAGRTRGVNLPVEGVVVVGVGIHARGICCRGTRTS